MFWISLVGHVMAGCFSDAVSCEVVVCLHRFILLPLTNLQHPTALTTYDDRQRGSVDMTGETTLGFCIAIQTCNRNAVT